MGYVPQVDTYVNIYKYTDKTYTYKIYVDNTCSVFYGYESLM